MPIATPNRIADPVSLEGYTPPCILIQENGLYVPYYNSSLTLSIIAGEPLVFGTRVCIAQRTILPLHMGTLITEWIVDAIMDPAHAADILQGDLVYWSTIKNAVVPVSGGAAVAGIGAAIATVPGTGEGFILGRAAGPQFEILPASMKNGGTPPLMVCARDASPRVRVMSLPGAATVY